MDDVNAENLLPSIEFTEDETDALGFPVDTSRQLVGGGASIDTHLKRMFRDVLLIENELAANPGDLDLQNALARAKEEYRWTKDYVIKTGPDQAGLTEEERAAA